MANNPTNRFVIQITNGKSFLRSESPKGGLQSAVQVLAELRRFCDDYERTAVRFDDEKAEGGPR